MLGLVPSQREDARGRFHIEFAYDVVAGDNT